MNVHLRTYVSFVLTFVTCCLSAQAGREGVTASERFRRAADSMRLEFSAWSDSVRAAYEAYEAQALRDFAEYESQIRTVWGGER